MVSLRVFSEKNAYVLSTSAVPTLAPSLQRAFCLRVHRTVGKVSRLQLARSPVIFFSFTEYLMIPR